MSMKTYYPVRREHNESLDAAVIGASIEGLLCALSLSQLDAVTVKVGHFRGLSGEMSGVSLHYCGFVFTESCFWAETLLTMHSAPRPRF